MQGNGKLTLPGLLVIVGVVGILVIVLVPTLVTSPRATNRTICMSNLSSINKALIIYRGENNGAWPWIANVTSDWSDVPVATDRNRDPFKDPNAPGERSITSLMFLLVRMNQSPGMFRCPSDKTSMVDLAPKAGTDDGDVLEGEYYWDFANRRNVSFSWQGPIWKAGRFAQGIDSAEPEAIIVADMSPKAVVPGWTAADVSKLSGRAVANQNSPNHKGKQNNVLRVAGYVQPQKRPDVGVDKDNIYTASGDPNAGSRAATSLDIRKHLSPRDTFLIGPVGGKPRPSAKSGQ